MANLDKRYNAMKAVVYELDKGICHLCNKKVPYNGCVLDHIIPKSRDNIDFSSPDEAWNLRLAHKTCNSKRGNGRQAGQIRLFGIIGEEVTGMHCPECNSTHLAKAGTTWRARKQVQRWRCVSCGRLFTEGDKKKRKPKPST